MRGFAVIVKDRGEDRCVAVFSQKFRARSYCRYLNKTEPETEARMVDILDDLPELSRAYPDEVNYARA